MDRLENELNSLFAEYRKAIGDPDVSADFTPRLWRKIEARRNFTWRLRRMSQVALAAALGLCFVVGGAALVQRDHISGTYADVLADAQPHETVAFLGVHLDPDSEQP